MSKKIRVPEALFQKVSKLAKENNVSVDEMTNTLFESDRKQKS